MFKMVFLKLENGKFIESKEKLEGGFYMDNIVHTTLTNAKHYVRQDWDYLYCVDGEVGSGKSWLAAQLAYFASDGKITMDQIVFTPEDFKKQILKANKYEAVVFDESFRGLSSRGALSKTNKVLTGMLQEIRQKNLFVFIVLPSIWDLDKYVSLHRCKGLFHVYTNENKERGYYSWFNKNQIKFHLKKYDNKYSYPKPSKYSKGKFPKYFPFEVEEYKKKKGTNLDSGYGEEEKQTRSEQTKDKYALLFKETVKKLAKSQDKTIQQICEEIGFNYGTYTHIGRNFGREGRNNYENEQHLAKIKESFTE